ncbi:MAG TPA: glycosyltransferase family 4 protein [Rhizobiaceae bacterium]|nr:glycosyltransferase family 4 protein [Rhizobiaceae bacterium]
MALTILSVAYPFAPVGPNAVGGAEQVLSAIDQALVERGHRSVVIACEGSEAAGELIAQPLPDGSVDENVRRCVWASQRSAIDTVLRKERIDLVHMHGIDFFEYLPTRGPTLATLHLPLDWYPVAIFRPRADLWLHCVSEAQHATAPAGVDLLPPIPNGISPRLLETHIRKRDYAVVLSRICPEKGIHIALEASRLADIPLLIGGKVFPYEAHQHYFETKVAPLLDRHRRFLGPLGFERKRRLLAGARCVLIPSLVPETSSLTAMEALACGTPVIAFPNGALPEVVEHGRTGFLVKDAVEMAEAITACEEINPNLCKATARERFSLDRMISAYLRCYRRLCGLASDRRPAGRNKLPRLRLAGHHV